MSETMIDKVAMALADSLDDSLSWMEYREQAETCIGAMEPTEAMLIAAFSWDEHVGMEETYPMYRGIFRAMMKAALKESEQ